MADMNKRKNVPDRLKDLESELIGNITDQQAEIETGKDEIKTDKTSKDVEKGYRMFNITQGKRRRHPDRVLSQYNAIRQTTENAESIFEKALLHEDESYGLDAVYKPSGHNMIADQLGVVTTALDNYVKSKQRFARSMPVGV